MLRITALPVVLLQVMLSACACFTAVATCFFPLALENSPGRLVQCQVRICVELQACARVCMDSRLGSIANDIHLACTYSPRPGSLSNLAAMRAGDWVVLSQSSGLPTS